MNEMTPRHDWSLDEMESLLNLPFNDLMFRAQTVHRQRFDLLWHIANRKQVATDNARSRTYVCCRTRVGGSLPPLNCRVSDVSDFVSDFGRFSDNLKNG